MSHAHHHTTPHIRGRRLLLIALLNVGFSLVEMISGILFNSTALLSDALHDMGDGIVLFTSAIIDRYSERPASERYSYGYRRLAVIGALFNNIILLLGSLWIINHAVARLLAPEPVISLGMFIMSILGIVVNFYCAMRLHGSTNILDRSVMTHLAEDLLGWIAVCLASIIIYFTHWYWLDPLLSLAVALVIIYSAVKNLLSTARIIMMGTPNDHDKKAITHAIAQIDTVIAITKLHYWTLDGEHHVLVAELEVTHVDAQLSRQISDILAPYHFADVTIAYRVTRKT